MTSFHRTCIYFCSKVKVFEHSLHVLNATLSSKLGCCLVFRKSLHAHSLLSYAVHTASILRLSNESLEHLLLWQNLRIAKSSTKAVRIRKLLETDEVKKKCSSASIESILKSLAEQEEKRKKKTSSMKSQTWRPWNLVTCTHADTNHGKRSDMMYRQTAGGNPLQS